MHGSLKGIRVLDLSRVLAGPWATQLLGDYGADVVKVERPGSGDDTRKWGPPWLGGEAGESAYYLSTNRNKRSLTVDLSTDAGRELIRSLAAKADILVENFRVGTMARYGLSAESLQNTNPGLVYCSISAYGQDGSKAGEPGYDAMIQASAGLMSITGPAEGEGGGPQKVGVAVADIMTGMYATTAILAALRAREASGHGQVIDVPLFDTQVAWLANQNMNFLVGGVVPSRLGTAHPNIVPYQAFTTADGHLMLAVGNDRQFQRCVAALDLPELADDASFASNAARVANRSELIGILRKRFAELKTADTLTGLREVGVPCGPINSVKDVFESDYAAERGLVQRQQHPLHDELPAVSNPVSFSATPVSYDRAPPMLGQHTDEVLREWLGYSPETIDALKGDGAI